MIKSALQSPGGEKTRGKRGKAKKLGGKRRKGEKGKREKAIR
jgi:hypothetical protein